MDQACSVRQQLRRHICGAEVAIGMVSVKRNEFGYSVE